MNKHIDRLRALIEVGQDEEVIALLRSILTPVQRKKLIEGVRDLWAQHLLFEMGTTTDRMDQRIQAVLGDIDTGF